MTTGSSCPACGAAGTHWAVAHDVEYRTSDESFEYDRCGACGVVFLRHPPVDRLAEIYPPSYYAYAEDDTSLAQRIKAVLDRRELRRLLATVPGTALTALDVGGGDGWMLSRLRELDARVRRSVVVDLDKAAQDRAMERGHEYFCGRIEDYPDDAPFDVVLLLNLIEHVADPGAVLHRLGERLSPGGVILVKTPNVDSLDARLFRHRDWGGYHCPRHWVLFDGPSFVATAQRAGLSVRSLRYTQGAPFWAVSVLASLLRRDRVTITAERPMVRHPLFPPLLGAFGAFDLARSVFRGHPSQMFVELVRGDA